MAGKQTRGLSKREDGRHIEEFQNARGSRMLFAFVIALISLSPISLQPKEAASLPCLIQVNEDDRSAPRSWSAYHTFNRPWPENKRGASQSGKTVDTLRSFKMHVAAGCCSLS